MLDEEQAPFNLAKYSSYLIDPAAFETTWQDRLRLEDLIGLPATSFAPVTTRKIGFGWSNAVHHIKTPLVNPTDQTQARVLAFNQIAWGHKVAYLVIEGEPLPTAPLFLFPDVEPWQDRDRFQHIEFEMPSNGRGTLYVSYANNSSYAPLSIENAGTYETRRMVSELRIYILLGLVLGVTVLTVSLLGVLYQRVAVFYALYLTFSTFHLCYVLGLFPFIPFLAEYVYPIMRFWWAAFALMSYLLFQRSFFATAPQVPKLLGNVLLIAAGLVLATTFAFDFLGAPFEPVIIWSTVCICLIAANGIVAIIKRVSGRWFFAAGCLMLVIMLVPLNLSDFLTAYYTYEEAATVFLFGLAFEAIALSCAMFARVRELRTEKEEALVAELKAAEERRTMSERLATAAHDIQQPLTSMKLAAQDNQKQLDELGGAIEFLDEIVKSQLTGDGIAHKPLLNDADEREEIKLNVILDNLKTMFAAEADDKGLSFEAVPTSKKAIVNAFALMRVLSNLVSNSIKNTDTGGVTVQSIADEDRVGFEVRDTGPGLSAEQLSKLKTPYQRAGDYDGHGLGLAIVEQLSAQNRFEMRVEPNEPHGTCFQIWLPAPED